MADFVNLIKQCNMNETVTILERNDNRYVVYSQTEDDEWRLVVTDGRELWKATWNKPQLQEIETKTTLQKYFSELRSAFDKKEFEVNEQRDELTLQLRDQYEAKWVLRKMSSANRQSELSTLLFNLSQQMLTLQSNLTEMRKQKQSADRQTYQPALTSLDAHRKTNRVKIRQREGMSLLNPSSKRHKPPQGIDFDSSQ